MKNYLNRLNQPHTMMKMRLKSVKNCCSIIIQHQSIPPVKFKRHANCCNECANSVFPILNGHSSMRIQSFCKMPNYYPAPHCINCSRERQAFVIMIMESELLTIYFGNAEMSNFLSFAEITFLKVYRTSVAQRRLK